MFFSEESSQKITHFLFYFRSNSELESIHEDVRLETPSTTLETVAETGQPTPRNVKNHLTSPRSADMEHSQSRDHFDETTPRRLPPGPGFKMVKLIAKSHCKIIYLTRSLVFFKFKI